MVVFIDTNAVATDAIYSPLQKRESNAREEYLSNIWGEENTPEMKTLRFRCQQSNNKYSTCE